MYVVCHWPDVVKHHMTIIKNVIIAINWLYGKEAKQTDIIGIVVLYVWIWKKWFLKDLLAKEFYFS